MVDSIEHSIPLFFFFFSFSVRDQISKRKISSKKVKEISPMLRGSLSEIQGETRWRCFKTSALSVTAPNSQPQTGCTSIHTEERK